jgi:hypothetical protein
MEREGKSFSIRCRTILMELEVLLEKVKILEQQIKNFLEGDPQVSKNDFFTPDQETLSVMPPRKKMRL